ncbi:MULTISPECIES: hypothetical protein [unclassified Fibrobacter]|uniref:hypothetical protein n=1 Tax=unclassified Fibrobacter TaxID=2634177 RepID=UPI0025C2E9A7|nr:MULTISPECIES: hypothetical protein [unclassified Fibrobacter]
MCTDTELAAAFSLLSHKHLPVLCKLRDWLNNVFCDSEIGFFTSENKDNRRLYLAYYFKCSGTEYKFVICLNQEDLKGTFFHLGFRRKDNHKIDNPTDVANCQQILNAVNASLKTNYGLNCCGKTLYLNPLSEYQLKFFLNAARSCMSKIPNFKGDCKNGFFTLTKAKEIVKNL